MAERLPDIVPLHQLMRLLKANGFVLGLDSYMRAAEYLQWAQTQENLDRETLRAQLSALLCITDAQQAVFGALFDRFLPPGLKPVETTPAGVDETPEEPSLPPPPVVPPSAAGPPVAPPLPATASPVPTGKRGPVLPLLEFPEEHLRLWNLHDMGAALSPLQEKVWTDTLEWDVPASIRAMIKSGGFPKTVYKKRKQAPRYLALIEQKSARDHLAGYAAELVREINRRDLEADFYFFDQHPAHCWKVQRDAATHVSLERLKSEWNGARLLVLGHASRLVDAETGLPSNLAFDLLHDFSNVALLATNEPLSWGAAERSLSTLMPVLPMSVEGLGRLMDAWNGAPVSGAESWQTVLPDPLPPDLSVRRRKTDPDGFYLALYRYLGADAYKWLCAACVYPELYFELTSILHDEAIPARLDLSEWQRNERWNDAMRRLSRLEWFRSGYLPEAVRETLKNALRAADLAVVEAEIRRVLAFRKNRGASGTIAQELQQGLFDWLADQNFRVLWIDDKPQNNEMLVRRWSKDPGVLFRLADSNLDAIYKLSTEVFDLVISDLGRPSEEKPGMATLQMASGRAPVVFYTSKRGLNLRSVLMNAGALEVTDSPADLEAVIRDLWGKKFGGGEPVAQETGSSFEERVPEPPREQKPPAAPNPVLLDQQQKLQRLGFYDGEPNGLSDARYKAAVTAFQREYGLFADGIAGPQTISMLEKALSMPPPMEQTAAPESGPNDHLRAMIREGRLEEALEEMLDLWPDEQALVLVAATYYEQKRGRLPSPSGSSLQAPQSPSLSEELMRWLSSLELVPTVRDLEPADELTEVKRSIKRALVYSIQEGYDVAEKAVRKDSEIMERFNKSLDRYWDMNRLWEKGALIGGEYQKSFESLIADFLLNTGQITTNDLNRYGPGNKASSKMK